MARTSCSRCLRPIAYHLNDPEGAVFQAVRLGYLRQSYLLRRVLGGSTPANGCRTAKRRPSRLALLAVLDGHLCKRVGRTLTG